MKILLVVPVHRKQNFKRFFQPAPLNIMVLASLTPWDVQVSVIDENIEQLNFDTDADLIGITATTSEVKRAYAIADAFRRRGKTVVMGGIHASACPEEALMHADSIVIGEAEGQWRQLVEDYRANRLQKRYRNAALPTLHHLPIPDRRIVNGKRYLTRNVCQISRGCPYHCIFCSVTPFFGNRYRVRDEAGVLREIGELDGRFLIFIDDNIFGDTAFAERLLKKLIPLKKRWVSQCTLRLADNAKLLKLAAESGCMGMLVGLESVSKDSLKASGKPVKFEHYAERIRRIIDHGIHIDGAFVFGFDNEDASIFERTLEFASRIKLSAGTFSILTPFPGTRLMAQLERENRIIDRDWEHYDGTHVVYRPMNMTPDQLETGRAWIKQEFYRFPSIFKRVGFRTSHVHYLWLYNLLKQGGTSKGRRRKVRNPFRLMDRSSIWA